MTDGNGHRVSVREFLEQKICALDERLDERFKARDENLVRQAEEYERRLEGLNGEQARIAAANAKNLPREVADQRQKDYEDWRDAVNKNFATAAGSASSRTNTLVIVSAIVSAIVAAIITAVFKT